LNALNDFEKVFNEFNKLSKENNLKLNIVILENHPYYDSKIMNSIQKRLKIMCNKNASSCLSLDLKKIRKQNDINHLTKSEYKEVSILISNFIGK
tara:strand:+ start:144 stop:428 length:285 start_codon:yes stop_codon:yes gene_type:complete